MIFLILSFKFSIYWVWQLQLSWLHSEQSPFEQAQFELKRSQLEHKELLLHVQGSSLQSLQILEIFCVSIFSNICFISACLPLESAPLMSGLGWPLPRAKCSAFRLTFSSSCELIANSVTGGMLEIMPHANLAHILLSDKLIV